MLIRCLLNLTRRTQWRAAIRCREFAVKLPDVKVRVENRGKLFEARGKIGESIFEVVVNADLPIDGFGACEGTLACCTCHVVLDDDHYKRIPEPTEEEMDLLDLAPEVTDHSRLGCQVILTDKDLPQIEVHVPSEIHDARSHDDQ